MSSSTFSDCTARLGGGAIYAEGEGTSVTIDRGTFVGNGVTEEPGRGGAVGVTGGTTVEISDSQFTDNYGLRGAGLYCNGGVIDNTTFSGGASREGVSAPPPARARVSRLLGSNLLFLFRTWLTVPIFLLHDSRSIGIIHGYE